MERFLNETLLGQEIEVLCLDGGKFSGVARAVTSGVLTLEWEEKSTYVSCDKIIAAWLKEDKARPTASLGFGPR